MKTMHFDTFVPCTNTLCQIINQRGFLPKYWMLMPKYDCPDCMEDSV